MVTIEELNQQIEREKLKRKKIELQIQEGRKMRDLQAELKRLKKTPGQLRNERLFKRTSRGFKLLGKKIGSAAIRQGKRIRKQQLRDLAVERPIRKTKKRKKQKTSNVIEDQIFGGMPSLGGGL